MGKRLIYNLVRERLFRTVLTDFLFLLEFRKYMFSTFFNIFSGFIYIYIFNWCGKNCLWLAWIILSWKLRGRTFFTGFCVGVAISLTFECFSILTRVTDIYFFYIFVIFVATFWKMKSTFDTRLEYLLAYYFIVCKGAGPTTCPNSLIS